MKVKELMKILESVNPEAEVVIDAPDLDAYIEYEFARKDCYSEYTFSGRDINTSLNHISISVG